MAWHDFGEPALQAIKAHLEDQLGIEASTEVTTGEPAYECGGTIVAAWISGVAPTPGDETQQCTYTPRVTWTVRLHHCQDPERPADHAEAWHGVLEGAYCALTSFLLGWCETVCVAFFDGVIIPAPLGTQIIADFSITLEEGCTSDQS